MFKKVLIANRGEIAVRIMRACRELSVSSVAVYSEADRNSMHVKLADEAVCIGPAAAAKSYLNVPNVISAAEITECDAIHPGYGFLAENTDFADICKKYGIVFIGPESKVIESMGNKAKARDTMVKAGVPVVPGSDGILTGTIEESKKLAKKIGYPVLLKASAGGGGKGMRVVRSEDEFENALAMAQMEAKAAFSNDDMYMEKFIETARHIEFQVLCDNFGNMVHLGERDCSVQRRHQKLIEESPSPALSDKARKKLGEYAIRACKAVNYTNAGTVEFIMAGPDEFYFMEMNTRLQVEHPVTELITGIDLVQEQLKIASGEKLAFTQKDIKFNGHAIEFRINAENPDNNFAPSPGKITLFEPPLGPFVRMDTMAATNVDILPFYDSLIAKVIVWGNDRNVSLARARRCLHEFGVEGVKTTIPLHLKIIENEKFIKGDIDTGFLEKELPKT